MKTWISRIMLALAIVAGLSSIAACEVDEGPAEEIGEEIDEG